MSEVLSVARVYLPDNEITAAALPDTVAHDVVAHENPLSVFKPSMLVDLEAGRPIEVEAIIGGIVRRAKARGVDVPRLTFIYAALKVIQVELIKRYNDARE